MARNVIIISGGSSGIGLATAVHMASKRDCIVYNFDLNDCLDEEKRSSENIHFVKCNMKNVDEINNGVRFVMEKEKKIDYLFANAGIHMFGTVEETSMEDFDNIVSINIRGTFAILKAVLPHMRAAKKGAVVLCGSDQCFIGKGGQTAYGLTKAAIGQLTKSVAIDYAPHGIRVNCVCPGTVETTLYFKAMKLASEKHNIPIDVLSQSVSKSQPIGRNGKPEEIASVVSMMLSDDASFMVGSLVSVDGGFVAQ